MVFGLIFLFCSVLLPAQVKAEAQAIPTISLEEGNVILPGTDVELIAIGGNNTYAMVSYPSQSKFWLFLSENKGRSWKKLPARGLPEEEKFIALEVSDATIALVTTTKVFLSRDGGKTFPSLSGPPLLVERGEAITSLAVAGESVLVGVWHPSQGKTPQEGVYLWTGTSWEWEGMRKDVTAVGFLDGCILAVASDNATTCLNIAYPGQRTFWGANWNQFPGCSGWPIEVAQTPGQSPTESEILSSKMALSEFDYREGKIYIIYNTRTRQKDDVYKVEFGENWKPEEVRKLSIPKAPELLSLDSIDYNGTATSGTLAVGVTTVEDQQTSGRIDGAHAYRLSSVDERGSPSNWENIWMRTGGYTYNSQVSFGPDRKLFVGTSGLASCFGREDGSIIIPISLIDASRGISQLTPSPNFLKDKALFINSGSRDILKIVLGEDYSLVEAQRVLYAPQGFGGDRIKIIPTNQNLFVFERGTKRWWVSPSWRAVEKEVEIVDAFAVADGKVWWAGKDNMLYQDGQRFTSGLNWIQKIEPGPPGKILVVGGVKEGVFDTISLAGGSPKFLPVLPVPSQYLEVAYSPADKFIYCGLDGRLYQLAEDWEAIGGNWQKVKDFERIYKILTASQGLYVFCQSKVYFSAFPITKESRWTVLGGEELKGYYWSGCQLMGLDEERNLLVLWESGKILLWTHQAKAEADAQAKAKAEADAKVKAEAEAKVKAEADAQAKAKAEAEAKVKAEADAQAKAKAEADAKVKAEAEAKAKAEAVRPPPAETKQPPPTTEKPPPKVFVREVKPEAFPQGAFVPVAILVLSAGGFIYWVVHSIRRRKKLRP